MSRVASVQADLFSLSRAEVSGLDAGPDLLDPVGELRALLGLVRGRWRRSGGRWVWRGRVGRREALLSAVFLETERLLAMTD